MRRPRRQGTSSPPLCQLSACVRYPRRYRKTVQQLLHTFRRLGALLRPVLAPDVFVDTAAQLVQAVCRQIMGECSTAAADAPARWRSSATVELCRVPWSLGLLVAAARACCLCLCRIYLSPGARASAQSSVFLDSARC